MTGAEQSSAWRDLRPRVLSALVMVVVAGGCIGLGGIAYTLMVLLAMGGMAAEAADLFRLRVQSLRGGLYVLWAVCAGLSAAAGHWGYFILFCISACVFGAPLCAVMSVIIMQVRLCSGSGRTVCGLSCLLSPWWLRAIPRPIWPGG
nr:hypothetical protein [Acetobacter okinawensis]